ncbi:S-adenosylmethionine uptake transporter [uncultured Gammaproteobacteria bacterium]
MKPSSAATTLAIGLAVAGFALFTIMDTVIKWLSGSYSLTQIVFFNALFAMVTILTIAARSGGLAALRTRRPGLHLLRASLGLVGAFTGFYALGLMPLADFYAVIFSAPLFITALSGPLLGERVGWRRWLAVLVGFGGVLIMLHPDQGMVSWGAFGALAAALFYALAMLLARGMGGDEPAVTFAFYGNINALAICGLLLPFSYIPPDLADLGRAALAGAAGGVAVTCVLAAFRLAPAAVVAPFQYTQMVWGVLIGMTVFGDQPDLQLVAGAGIVITSGLYLLVHESRQVQVAEAIAESVVP